MHIPCTKNCKKHLLVAKVGSWYPLPFNIKLSKKSVEVKPRMDSRPAGKRSPTLWHNGNNIVFSPTAATENPCRQAELFFFSTNGTLQGKKSLICQLLKWRFSHKNSRRHHTKTKLYFPKHSRLLMTDSPKQQ